MKALPDLSSKSPQEWDAAISQELRAAGVDARKFREYDSPNSWVKHTLQGVLGDWTFLRDSTIYSFWGDVPLATAEVIATDEECVKGCMPMQWLPGWGNQPNPSDVNAKLSEHVAWLENGMWRVKDKGFSEEYKQCLQKDAYDRLVFVDDPSTAGAPLIRNYTFFTTAALNNFVAIAKRHRVPFTRAR